MNTQPLSSTPVAHRERRRAKRSALRMRANVTLPGDLTLEAHTIDISLHGLSCRVPYALDDGQSCTIELDLKRFGGGTVELQTLVRNCQPTQEGRFQAGLEFLNMSGSVAELLKTFLR